MTVSDLVLQYEDDVLSRIQTLEEDKAELIKQLDNLENRDFCRDWDDQIAHWKATLVVIQDVIKRERLR
jgi:hypothetical protein